MAYKQFIVIIFMIIFYFLLISLYVFYIINYIFARGNLKKFAFLIFYI